MPVDLGRRNWLKNLLPQAVDTVATAVSQTLPKHLRPPGAVDEASFLALCTACNDCVLACPPRAIFTLNEGLGAKTPVMAPDERACLMCDGWPCATACTTGALRVPTTPTVRFGTVSISRDHCFTFRGPECGACGGLCPGNLRAITFSRARPSVDEEACVGCGRCIDACPTSPKAIVFLERTLADQIADEGGARNGR